MLLMTKKDATPSAADPNCFRVKNQASLWTESAIANDDVVTARIPVITNAITTAINRPSKDVHQANTSRKRSFRVRFIPAPDSVIPVVSRFNPHQKSTSKPQKVM